MEFQEFVKHKKRMCEYYSDGCYDEKSGNCPLYYEKICLVNASTYITKYDDKGIRNKGGKKDGKWVAVADQFQVPYVFKTLFSKEPIEFKDECEVFSVKEGDIYTVKENSIMCSVFCMRNPKVAEEIVSKWASEHPVITNRQKFKEVFGVDVGGPSKCIGIKCPEKYEAMVTCNTCPYRNFWDKEYKESTNEE